MDVPLCHQKDDVHLIENMNRVRSMTASAGERAAREIEHGRRICKSAEKYWGWASPAGQLRADRRAQLLTKYGEITKETYCLEVGCGTGLFTSKIARTGAHIDAIDISPDLLAEARGRPGLENVSFIQEDIERAQNLLGPYDAVIGVSVLHHLDLSLAVPNLFRVLKPDGRFVFTEPNLRNPQVWLQKNVVWIKKLLGDSPNETAFVREQVVSILQDHGFAWVSVTPFDWLHPWTPRPMIPLVVVLGSVLEGTPVIREMSGSLLVVARKP